MKKLLTLVTLLGVTTAASANEPRKVVTIEGITEYAMDNGLRVLLFPDNSKAQVTVNVTYLVGSRHEGYGETGMAHLLEHMLFKGTTRHQKIWAELDAHGARFNGSTWYDRTNYFETLNATDDNLKWALDMEADRMVNSRVSKQDLSSEFSVVRNEFEMGENIAAGGARGAPLLHRLPVAQLRQVDHRIAQRHRAGADREPAGLLPPLLPAG